MIRKIESVLKYVLEGTFCLIFKPSAFGKVKELPV